MSYIFILSIVLLILTIPIHYLSIEHKRLIRKYGIDKGKKYGKIFGKVSGYGHFVVCFGIWLSPQPKFHIYDLLNIIINIPKFHISISINIVNLIISIPFITAFAVIEYFAVNAVSMKTATTHYVEKIIKTGIYSYIRHPQHLGQLFLYIGMTILFSGLYSMLFFPIYLFIITMLSKKEEKELIDEFGEEYGLYKEQVPFLIPKLNLKKIY